MSRVDPAPPPVAHDVVLVPISDIHVGDRHRKEISDLYLQGLADTIREFTLLNPILITSDHQLVCGELRLRACRDILGWTEIPARIFDTDRITEVEYIENEWRKDLTITERTAILATMERKRVGHPKANSADLQNYGTAAKSLGFSSERVAQEASAVVRNGVEELVAAMDGKEISIDAAAIIAKEKPEVQQQIVALPEAERRVKVAELRNTPKVKRPRKKGVPCLWADLRVPFNGAQAAVMLVERLPERVIDELLSELPAALAAEKERISRLAKENAPTDAAIDRAIKQAEKSARAATRRNARLTAALQAQTDSANQPAPARVKRGAMLH